MCRYCNTITMHHASEGQASSVYGFLNGRPILVAKWEVPVSNPERLPKRFVTMHNHPPQTLNILYNKRSYFANKQHCNTVSLVTISISTIIVPCHGEAIGGGGGGGGGA